MSIILKPVKPTKAEPMATTIKTEYRLHFEDPNYPHADPIMAWTESATVIKNQIFMLFDKGIDTTVEVRHTKVMSHTSTADAFLRLHFPSKDAL